MSIWFFFSFLSAIGDGIVRPNLIAFGADQTQELESTSRYFNKYATIINIGAIFDDLIKIFFLKKYMVIWFSV